MVRAGLILIILLALGCGTEEPVNVSDDNEFMSLIDMASFEAIPGERDSFLIEVMPDSIYAAGHIPGGIQLWRNDIQDRSFDFGGMAIDRNAMRKLLDSLGVASGEHIVLSDHKGGCDAARLWWLLKLYGHENVSLLDGGLRKWQMLERELSDSIHSVFSASGFNFGEPDLSLKIGQDEILQILDDTNYVLVDTRSLDEYTGQKMKKGASRPGRIPGAVLYDWGNAVEMSGDCCVKGADVLDYDLKALGITKDKKIITYCHTGVRSAHTTFILKEILGYPYVQNYDGSWTEWSYNLNNPIEITEYE